MTSALRPFDRSHKAYRRLERGMGIRPQTSKGALSLQRLKAYRPHPDARSRDTVFHCPNHRVESIYDGENVKAIRAHWASRTTGSGQS